MFWINSSRLGEFLIPIIESAVNLRMKHGLGFGYLLDTNDSCDNSIAPRKVAYWNVVLFSMKSTTNRHEGWLRMNE